MKSADLNLELFDLSRSHFSFPDLSSGEIISSSLVRAWEEKERLALKKLSTPAGSPSRATRTGGTPHCRSVSLWRAQTRSQKAHVVWGGVGLITRRTCSRAPGGRAFRCACATAARARARPGGCLAACCAAADGHGGAGRDRERRALGAPGAAVSARVPVRHRQLGAGAGGAEQGLRVGGTEGLESRAGAGLARELRAPPA